MTRTICTYYQDEYQDKFLISYVNRNHKIVHVNLVYTLNVKRDFHKLKQHFLILIKYFRTSDILIWFYHKIM